MLTRVNPARVLWLVVAAASLAACGDGTAPARPDATVDSLLADVSAIDSYSAMGTTMLGVPPVPTTRTASAACVFVAASQSFECPPVTSGGMTAKRTYQLLDATGKPQSAFDQATTAAIRTIMDLSGTMVPREGTTPPFTVTIASHSDQTLSGLLTSTRTVNGTGNSTATITSQGTTFTVTSTQKTESLVLPARGSASPYPSSGKITVATTMPGLLGTGTRTSTMVMTYNGTSTMTMTMTTDGRTITCLIDMSKPGTPPTCTVG